MCKTIEELKAIVDKLPKTADRVTIVPGMKLYYIHYVQQYSWKDKITPAYCEVREIDYFAIDGDGVISHDYGDLDHNYGEDLYSTIEAAQKVLDLKYGKSD